jgi:hypothetical protein
MEYPRIKYVSPKPYYLLDVVFENGIQKLYDFKPMLSDERFENLKDLIWFNAVRVDTSGCGIFWDNDHDLSEYELWINGIEKK